MILPTYNEAENIGPIVEAVSARLAEGDRILIVDDNSPDGTGRIADELAEGSETVEVLHRPLKEGLAASELADLVLGSRYVPGGGITEWGAFRKLISRGGSLYSRTLLGVPVRDLTGGFKCFRREVLETIELDQVATSGYSFQIEMTYRVPKAGFDVLEVPITFRERTAGKSKMSTEIVAEAMWKVPAMRVGPNRVRPVRRHVPS